MCERFGRYRERLVLVFLAEIGVKLGCAEDLFSCGLCEAVVEVKSRFRWESFDLMIEGWRRRRELATCTPTRLVNRLISKRERASAIAFSLLEIQTALTAIS